MSKLGKLLHLRPRDARDIFCAYYYLAAAGWRLFVRQDNLGRWLLEHPEQSQPSDADRARISEVALWTNRVARALLPSARCLQRSLALCLWLEHEGYRTSLRIGARREGSRLEAHAWVEYGGKVINDREIVRVLFPELSGAGARAVSRHL